MKLRFEQLGDHLNRHLAAVYLLHGDEPLLVQEATDAVRSAARARGYGERERLTVEAGFDWNGLRHTVTTLSLFTARRIVELQMGTSKLSDDGAQILQDYAARPPQDIVLLVSCAKLDLASQQSPWFTALEKAGVSVQVRPVETTQLPLWIEQRMQVRGLHPTAAAVALLAERVEGNLLAAAQEIEKLHLLFGTSSITPQQVQIAVSDSARYSVYDLVDAALAGQSGRCVRILQGLREEGIEAVLISWALYREIRLLASLRFALSQGEPVDRILNRNRVWEKRKSLVNRALQRLTLSLCRSLLVECARLDRLVKGLEQGDPWNAMLILSLRLAGREILSPVLRQTGGFSTETTS